MTQPGERERAQHSSPVHQAPPAGSAAPDDEPETLDGDDPGTRRLVPLLVGILVLVVVGGVTDLILDRPSTWRSLHVAFEVGLVLVSLTFAIVLWLGWWRTAQDLTRMRATLAATTRSLAERQAEQDAWRRQAESARTSFGRAIDAQFAAWELTPTEREIAFLLLQGHGHKQIAARTGRSDRTVRQHAVSIYQKSGIGGRSELAAFFLQDLLPGDAGSAP